MDMYGIESSAMYQHSAEEIKRICADYGLYGNVIYHNPSPFPESNSNRVYIVAGFDPAIEKDPLPEYLDPEDMIRRNERNQKIFHPRSWAFDLTEKSDNFQPIQELIDYCKMAEFTARIYGEHGMDVPEKIRYSELTQLHDFYQGYNNSMTDPGVKKKYKEGLDWFFDRAKKNTGLRKEWNEYFLSDQFPDDGGPVARISGFLKRKDSVISLEQLMDVNGDIHKLQMQEHEYRAFAKFMQDVYPDVKYAIDDIEEVDHGIPKASQRNLGTMGELVTGEEFATILKERFADEGFDAISNLKPAYWEYRDVYYKAVDEPLVATAYNHIRLAYAKCNPLMDLTERGPIRLKKVPLSDFMNFVSLAKANNLRFYIDNVGDYAIPSLETINVIYNVHQEEKMQSIVNRMVSDKIEYSHLFQEPERVQGQSLTDIIHTVEEKPKEISHNYGGRTIDLRDNDKRS